jgi:hypothetical protein
MTQANAEAPVSEKPTGTAPAQSALQVTLALPPEAAAEPAPAPEAPTATSPESTELAHAAPAESTSASAPITAQEVILPPTSPQPDANKPVLVMYQDMEGKNRIIITGDGHGKWMLPHWNQVENLPVEGVQLTFGEDKLTVANLGQRAEKPRLTIKDHAMFSWMPVDLAKLILGDQFHAIVPSEIQPTLMNLPKVESRPAENTLPQVTAIDPALLAIQTSAATPHAAHCAGCANCKPTPASTTVSAITHDGVAPATPSMLAMHGEKSTKLGAML